MKQILVTLAAVSVLGVASAQDRAPDNSGKNERDRSGETLTPGDQSNTPEDLKITRTIRQSLMDDEALTLTAKNVKIITAAGKVTLRGPVKTAAEKEAIVQHARRAAGEQAVTDELEIKSTR